MKNEFKQFMDGKKKIEFVITWRFVFYIFYISMIMLLVSNAIVHYYEDRMIMIVIWVMFFMSYPLSLFLIQLKEVW